MPAKKTHPNSELRTVQLGQIDEAITTLEARLQTYRQDQKDQLAVLDSVSRGLYDEIDKLAKKAPAEPITDLALEQINDVIRETKRLIGSDPYIQRLNEFVPAGDNPQQRDAVMVLRQIRQGLERFLAQLNPLVALLTSRLRDAKGIQIAIRLDLETGNLVNQKELKEEYDVSVSSEWLSGGHPYYFNFAKLDRTNVRDYFGDAKLI